MKFGIRDITDVSFKAKSYMEIGDGKFNPGQPVLMIDTATASTLEQATTTVYARGGRGNTKLVTWEGEKELTFTVTDALLSPIGMSILSGAGIFKSADTSVEVHIHKTVKSSIIDGVIDLGSGADFIDPTAPIFVVRTDTDGSVTGQLIDEFKVIKTGDSSQNAVTTLSGVSEEDKAKLTKLVNLKSNKPANGKVLVDYYTIKKSKDVSEIQIDANSFGGNFYVEALTYWKSQDDGKDYPVQMTLPNVKIQSNFTFNMSATGDPSTFDFVMDAMPGYTYFNNSHEVLCVLQVIEDTAAGATTSDSVMKHTVAEDITEAAGTTANNSKTGDSTPASGTARTA